MAPFRAPWIKTLQVSEVRNLESLRLDDLAAVNLISGPNGSGKTSILEAIYMLGMARSLRGASMGSVVRRGASACAVAGVLCDSDAHGETLPAPMRVDHNGERFVIEVAGNAVTSVAELARYLPMQTISVDTLHLVDGPPKLRRQMIDWGAFHVDPQFRAAWRRAKECLRQRNALLRAASPPGDAELALWSRELSRWAQRVDAMRRRCVDIFRPLFFSRLDDLAGHLGLGDMELSYFPGWKPEWSIDEALAHAQQTDLMRGYTSVGPHRAEARLRMLGARAGDVLSRGQQKLVAAALRLGLGDLLFAESGRRPVYLVDDLPSELDHMSRSRFCAALEGVGSQVFVTSIDPHGLDGMWRQDHAVQRFHLSRGRLVSGPH